MLSCCKAWIVLSRIFIQNLLYSSHPVPEIWFFCQEVFSRNGMFSVVSRKQEEIHSIFEEETMFVQFLVMHCSITFLCNWLLILLSRRSNRDCNRFWEKDFSASRLFCRAPVSTEGQSHYCRNGRLTFCIITISWSSVVLQVSVFAVSVFTNSTIECSTEVTWDDINHSLTEYCHIVKNINVAGNTNDYFDSGATILVAKVGVNGLKKSSTLFLACTEDNAEVTFTAGLA